MASVESELESPVVDIPPVQARVIDVENPATGAVVGSVADLTAPEVGELALRGRAAQVGWAATSLAERAKVFLRLQKWVIENRDELAQTVIAETGKTYEDAAIIEVTYIAAALGFWAKNAAKFLADEKVRSSNPLLVGKRIKTVYRPLGLVGVIGPWNYPLINSFGDAIPALMAGNSVILKPSEITPLTSLKVAGVLLECGLPPYVFQVATGRGDTGAALIDEVDMIMFTGSTKTGKAVMTRAAQTLTPVSLELGGKDPMIVLADADLERAANAATYYSMMNGGQTCISVERCYVEAPIYDEFIAKLTEKVSVLRQGPAGDPGTVDVGAVTFGPQLEIIERHIADARAKGARTITGGAASEGPGRFYQPTVLVDVDHTMTCMTEETFGPTLPVMRVRDAEEAIRLANDSPYGLSASIYTRDLERGEELARQIQAGAVCVNDAVVNYTALEAPFGGAKESGIGLRHGSPGIRKYTQTQTILVTFALALKNDLNMFPYNTLKTGILKRVLGFIYGRGKRD